MARPQTNVSQVKGDNMAATPKPVRKMIKAHRAEVQKYDKKTARPHMAKAMNKEYLKSKSAAHLKKLYQK
jgi:hypothetical protein